MTKTIDGAATVPSTKWCRRLETLAGLFLREGGFRERMTRMRIEQRKKSQ
jgi:hypothetical protein